MEENELDGLLINTLNACPTGLRVAMKKKVSEGIIVHSFCHKRTN